MISIRAKNIKIDTIGLEPKFELDKLVKRSKEVMSEYGSLFKSKTLEQLYTSEYSYKGCLPNSTYIIDKKTGERKLMFISCSKHDGQHGGIEERYTGRTYGLKKLGEKSFETIDKEGNPKLNTGTMKSKVNNRYAGTQIRLTQIEVERAIQMNEASIPLHAVAEALPFHTMMGFRPNETYSMEVKSISDVEKNMKWIMDACAGVKKEHFTPIVHYKEGKYYLDKNQTVANATLRHFKQEADMGKKRNFNSIFVSDDVEMNLSGKELEAWRQRALSQPILLKKSK